MPAAPSTAAMTPADDVDLDPSLLAPDVDPTCAALSGGSLEVIRSFLETANAQIHGFAGWRDGEGWSDGAGDEIPELRTLSEAARELAACRFTCDDQDLEVVPADDAIVRDALTFGVADQSGLSETEIDLINEWMAYDGGGLTGLADYFCLAPKPIAHEYGVSLTFGASASAGLGAGGKVDTPLGEVALGCYPLIQAGVSALRFSYSNNLGMRWVSDYGQASAEVGGECAARLRIGPSVATSFGDDGMCHGSASSATWYGPGDFTGYALTEGSSLGAGAGVDATFALSTMLVYSASGKPALLFDTSGPCLAAGAGAGGEIGGTAGAAGQVNTSSTMSNGAVADVPGVDRATSGAGACEVPVMDDVFPVGARTLLARSLLFDTGSDAVFGGTWEGENDSALRDITEALEVSAVHLPPDDVEFVVVGEASPRWRGAADDADADAENLALAGRRAEGARGAVLDAYDALLTLGWWPDASVDVSGTVSESRAPPGVGSIRTESVGSKPGLDETGDRANDDARFRRARVLVNVAWYASDRRTLPGGEGVCEVG